MEKLKTVKVRKETHKDLMLIKLQLGFDSLADVMEEKSIVKTLKILRQKRQ